MRDILQDIVAHTHALGFLNTVRITTTENSTTIKSTSDLNSIVLLGETHTKLVDEENVFGMTNLEKLNLHLKNPEYKENAGITIVIGEGENKKQIPKSIHFENQHKDFQNDFRLMGFKAIESRVRDVNFNGATWHVNFPVSVASIQRFKLMSAAHTEEKIFTVSIEEDSLVFSFGTEATHSGKFTFQNNITGRLHKNWDYPISEVQSILSLDGDMSMSLSDDGVMKISIDSGLSTYEYFLPTQAK